MESLYWRSSSSIGIFILEVVQSYLECLYWRSSSRLGMFILEDFQSEYLYWRASSFTLEYLYWRASSLVCNIYTEGHPVPLGIFILEIVQSIWNIYTGDRPVTLGYLYWRSFQFVHTGSLIRAKRMPRSSLRNHYSFY